MDTNIFLLCNFDDTCINSASQDIISLWFGNGYIEDRKLLNKLLSIIDLENELWNFLLDYSKNNSLQDILSISISAFLTFCEQNWKPDSSALSLSKCFEENWPYDVEATTKLQRDSETVYVNIQFPELLYFSIQIFSALSRIESSLVHLWWLFRSKVIHQRVLEDTSATLYSDLELIIAKLLNECQNLHDNPKVTTLLAIEISQAYLLYGRIQKAEEYLILAKDIAGVKFQLTGILGKRTKFQQKALAQLALSIETDEKVDRQATGEIYCTSESPKEIKLNDDVRLNKIQYNENLSQADLLHLEQNVCLLTVQYLQKAQPKDDLMQEEIQPYLEAILSQKTSPWSTRVATLLIRCKLEANHKRTVERAMQQCETIVNDTDHIENITRLKYLWASGLQPAWVWRQQLADLYLSLGLVKAALEQYEKLQLWEDVIVCYTILQLRHKAAEVIQQQIDIKPTVKLYCLLGDATDDEKCYEKAWEFSKHKSSRAQRHWGNYLFNQKRYKECIPHYEKSVLINSIQESVWLRLGYAALVSEDWDLSAKAYRRYTYLEPNTFEAWNNLAKVYVKLGDKNRSYNTLMEALRYNYDNWKLWENVIMVSMDTGHFEDVIRGCHRILDLTQKYEDVEVLSLLVRAILLDKQDADGNSAARLQKRVLELFGRITSVHQNKSELWQLYADISPSHLLKAQRLQKAYKGYSQIGHWANNPETCKTVLELTISLLKFSLKARQEAEEKDVIQADQQLSSARLTGQGVIRAAEKAAWPDTEIKLDLLKNIIKDITEYMKSLL